MSTTYYKGYKVRLDPTSEQISKLKQHVGAARFIWNYFLNYQKLQKEMGLDYKSKEDLSKLFTELRNDPSTKWLKDISSSTGQKVIRDLDKAIWAKGKGKPKFKSRRGSRQNYNPGEYIPMTINSVGIPKIGYIKLKETNRLPLDKTFENPRISFDGINWYLSIQVKCESQTLNKNTTEALGIDVGINNLITLSNNQMYKYSKQVLSRCKRKQKYIRRLQSIISHKKLLMKQQIGNTFEENKSKNLLHLEMLLRKAYQRDHNIRMDFIHKLTTKIIQMNPSKIVIEDLSVISMYKNKPSRFRQRLAQSLIGEILRQLEYKAMWNEIPLVKADRYYPSSKRCSRCGLVHRYFITDKYYYCPSCHHHEHRDINAAHNLVAYS